MRRGEQGCEVERKGIEAQRREMSVEKGSRSGGGEGVEKKWMWREKKTWHQRSEGRAVEAKEKMG